MNMNIHTWKAKHNRSWSGGIAQLIKHLPHKCEDLSLNAQKLILLDKVPGQLETPAANKMRKVPEDLYPSLSSDSEMPLA